MDEDQDIIDKLDPTYSRLATLSKPINLMSYAKIIKIAGPNITEEIQALCPYQVVSVVPSNLDHFVVKRDSREYFAKYCDKHAWEKAMKAHSVLDPYQHPHVIQVHESFPITEVTEGGIMITPLKIAFAWDVLLQFTKDVMRQLFGALAFCHSHHVYHGDIKPDNIVWQWNFNENIPHIRLIDFDSSYQNDMDYLSSLFLGTKPYNSPHRVHEYRIPGLLFVEDIWAAGITFAEMLLGLRKSHLLYDYEDIDAFDCATEPRFANLEPLARDLLCKLLTVEPRLRITAEQALQHPYFTGVSTTASTPTTN